MSDKVCPKASCQRLMSTGPCCQGGENISKSSAAPELWTPVGKEMKQALTGAVVACSQLRPFLRSCHQPAPGLVVLRECPAAALST